MKRSVDQDILEMVKTACVCQLFNQCIYDNKQQNLCAHIMCCRIRILNITGSGSDQ